MLVYLKAIKIAPTFAHAQYDLGILYLKIAFFFKIILCLTEIMIFSINLNFRKLLPTNSYGNMLLNVFSSLFPD